MIGIVLYYWREARYYRETGRQMLYDTGLKRTLGQRIRDGWEKCMRPAYSKRAARWTAK